MRAARVVLCIGLVCAVMLTSSAANVSAAKFSARPSSPRLPWAHLHNPILGFDDHGAKDPALVRSGGRWYALFSWVDAAGHWSIGITSSTDLRHWSPTTAMPHDPSVEGEASPDVVREPNGTWVVTYQSFVHDVAGSAPKLYFRTTTDFRSFSAQAPLALDVHPGANERVIDGALAWTPAGLLLGYKVGEVNQGEQAFEIARSPSGSLDGPWQLVGRPDIQVLGNTIENYQFLHVQGRWRLLATSNSFDRPFLFDLAGDAHRATAWLHWSKGRELHIPQEQGWNPGKGLTGETYEHANCAFLVDRRAIGGRYYLVYEDSPALDTFGGAGHAQLGIARSRDLIHWSVPPGS